ncbi:HNH endonuclease [Streptomyces sp. YC504]|uniref:HNH endonuclease n=1 Tax=Streptomyces mesophilus TaxID=1775132 RepID=A0A6G4XR12_9ACTN|nr:HNH endonuclease family protein [Streptomyces mesophilus]NGO79878.1 HNH endonuclease [Streptomyces mesophilus]
MRKFRTLGVLAALFTLPLTNAPAHAAEAPAPITVPLHDAIAALPVAPAASHDGYDRPTSFHHWIDSDHNRCRTREEALLAEAIEVPKKDSQCQLTGGRWYSYYDDTYVTDPGKLDIDHMVPLSQAWESGASTWSRERREAYANDLDAPRSLVAVTARSNRAKGDRDPADWMPPVQSAAVRCVYLVDWVATKSRWGLTVDDAEGKALKDYAAQCPNLPVAYTVVPVENDAVEQAAD